MLYVQGYQGKEVEAGNAGLQSLSLLAYRTLSGLGKPIIV
jgi:hypothetical protein